MIRGGIKAMTVRRRIRIEGANIGLRHSVSPQHLQAYLNVNAFIFPATVASPGLTMTHHGRPPLTQKRLFRRQSPAF